MLTNLETLKTPFALNYLGGSVSMDIVREGYVTFTILMLKNIEEVLA